MKNTNTSVRDLIFSYSLKSEGVIKKLQQRDTELEQKDSLSKEEEIEKGIIEKSLNIMTNYVKVTNDRISNADKLKQNQEEILRYYFNENTQKS